MLGGCPVGWETEAPLPAAQIFKRFHAAYMDAVCNPFYTMNTVRRAFLKSFCMLPRSVHQS